MVYIRLNMHFFIGPDCDASVVHLANIPDPINPYDLHSIAENLVSEANVRLSNNVQQWGGTMWGGPFPAPHQIPIRYILSDVHLHCTTEEMPPVLDGQDPQTMAGYWLFHINNYKINPLEEINVFVSKMSAGSGVAFPGGNGANISWWNTGLFNHEMGHTLNLTHVFENNDLCSDTPMIIWNYDESCDGDYNDEHDVINGYCWYVKDPGSTQHNPSLSMCGRTPLLLLGLC